MIFVIIPKTQKLENIRDLQRGPEVQDGLMVLKSDFNVIHYINTVKKEVYTITDNRHMICNFH